LVGDLLDLFGRTSRNSLKFRRMPVAGCGHGQSHTTCCSVLAAMSASVICCC
jgi:hypothetical protein